LAAVAIEAFHAGSVSHGGNNVSPRTESAPIGSEI
jgi:hypothetical protein